MQKYPQSFNPSTSTNAVTRSASRKTGGYSHRKADARLNRKRDEAEDRQVEYDALNLQEKIELVTSRGGSRRELARLNAALTLEKDPQVKQAPLTSEQKGAKLVKRAKDSVKNLKH